MHFLSTIAFLASATMTHAMVCTTGVTLSPNSTSDANPLFLVDSTGHVFHKYASNIGNATEAQMVAIEYLSAYDTDTEGNLWIVNNLTYGVAQLTADYRDYFGVDLDMSPSDNAYTLDEDRFQSLLSTVREDYSLQTEAQQWAAESKATHRALQEGSLVSRSLLESRFTRKPQGDVINTVHDQRSGTGQPLNMALFNMQQLSLFMFDIAVHNPEPHEAIQEMDTFEVLDFIFD
ncbi:uncharacterized protein BO80DRAFT_443003 [Aspergillus ibericus CBS 121593]|uniref:Uncharacterized protein n=1 Tax=Aspergillus ibericus CBS 121593 TaxID=1448316 RepID=A0A395H6Q5_9EURO|nr:hypothetical protein BO80DRAFT_443003 [Aspergillus ibericus CBS 121593]RAL03330.1 hypothetical protein BO80DRAFT_443003 [Aspergillus ibericus CBS 121593]